jgi:hypothetical protein
MRQLLRSLTFSLFFKKKKKKTIFVLFERKILKIIHRIERIFFFYHQNRWADAVKSFGRVIFTSWRRRRRKKGCVLLCRNVVSDEDDGYSHFNGDSSTEEKVNGFLFFFFFFLWAFACCANVELYNPRLVCVSVCVYVLAEGVFFEIELLAHRARLHTHTLSIQD